MSAQCVLCGARATIFGARDSYCSGCRAQCASCLEDAPKGRDLCPECSLESFWCFLGADLVSTHPALCAAVEAGVALQRANPHRLVSVVPCVGDLGADDQRRVWDALAQAKGAA